MAAVLLLPSFASLLRGLVVPEGGNFAGSLTGSDRHAHSAPFVDWRRLGGATAAHPPAPCQAGASWQLSGDAFSPLPDNAAVALGKFEALHRGHAEVAASARRLGCAPWLLSFSGMAEVLGRPPRLPLVAPQHRVTVLEAWGCVRERVLPFAEVRHLAPEQFVDLLVDVLRVRGVACGENFRFGLRAAGTSATLRALAERRGLVVDVVALQRSADDVRTISSTRIREALAVGDVEGVAHMLGRPHRVFWQSTLADFPLTSRLCWLCEPANQPPGSGVYKVSVALGGTRLVAADLKTDISGTLLHIPDASDLEACVLSAQHAGVSVAFDNGASALGAVLG